MDTTASAQLPWRSPAAVAVCIAIGIVAAVVMTAWAWALAPASGLSAEAHDSLSLVPILQACGWCVFGAVAAWMAAAAQTRRGAWASMILILCMASIGALRMGGMQARIGVPASWSPMEIRAATIEAVRDGRARSPSLIAHMLPSVR